MKNTKFFFLLFLIGCRKPVALPEPANIIGSWRQTAENANGQNLWCTYYYDSCALDDSWEFSADGNYRVFDSGLACSANSGARSGRWRLDGGRLLLDSLPYTIVSTSICCILIEEQQARNGFSYRHQLGFTRP